MNFYIQDFCCLCLSISNEKWNNKSSKNHDNLTPIDKIKTIFLQLSTVMDSDSRICLECSEIVNSTYKFNKTCLKNIKILNSYKRILQENQSKNRCNLFVNLNESKKMLTVAEIKTESPDSPLINDDMLCNTDFIMESHSRGAVQKFKVDFESCDGESETSRLDPEIGREIKLEANDVGKVWLDEMNETFEDESLEPNNKDFQKFSTPLHEEVFIKEEVKTEVLNDCVLEVPKSSDSSTKIRSHKCDICGKSFKHKHHLKAHLVIHTGEKPFKCDVCNKSFTQIGSRKIHMLTHTGEKRYKCNICEKLFIRKDDLKKHFLIHTGEKPYKCNECEKLFARKIDVRRHMLTHTGEKPYKCNICRKLFSQKCHLKSHFLIHSGEKRYECDSCEKSFKHKQNLRIHLLTHIDSENIVIQSTEEEEEENMEIFEDRHLEVAEERSDVNLQHFESIGENQL